MRFKDKTIIISGCNGEMAMEMAATLLSEGGKVIGLDKKETKEFERAFKNKHPERVFAFSCDLTNAEQISEVLSQIRGEFEHIDVLINHAGSTCSETLKQTFFEEWKKDVEVNLNGTFCLTRGILERMKEQKSGSVVTVASVNADRAVGNPAYSAAKAGLVSFSKSIAMEYGAYNIRSNVVSPGSVKTKAWNERIRKNPKTFENLLKWYPLKRLVSPKDVSNAVLFLASEEAASISGVNLRVDAGLSAGCALFAQDITSQDFGV